MAIYPNSNDPAKFDVTWNWTPLPDQVNIHAGEEWQFDPVGHEGQVYFSNKEQQVYVSDGTKWMLLGTQQPSTWQGPSLSHVIMDEAFASEYPWTKYQCPFCTLTWAYPGEVKGQGPTLFAAVEKALQNQIAQFESEFKQHLHAEHSNLYGAVKATQAFMGTMKEISKAMDAMKKITKAMGGLSADS